MTAIAGALAAGIPDSAYAAAASSVNKRLDTGVSQEALPRRAGSPRTSLIALEPGRHEPACPLLAEIEPVLGDTPRHMIWFPAGEPVADPAAPLIDARVPAPGPAHERMTRSGSRCAVCYASVWKVLLSRAA